MYCRSVASMGKVVGGVLINGTVTPGFGGGLVVQSGFKRRKLTCDRVDQWEEVDSPAGGAGPAAAGAVGKAVAGAVLPGVVGKMASAALDATINATTRPPRMVRVEWDDGKQSLLRLPEDLFTHLAMELRGCKAAGPASAPMAESAAPAAMLPTPVAPAIQADLIEQIAQLAVLRDQGVLTEDEFASKKAELLARL